MGIATLIILAIVVMVVFGASREPGDDSPNWMSLIGIIIAGGLLMAACAACGL